MEFRFENKTTVWDLWKLSMRNIYRSLVGYCNIIFSVAIIAMTIHFWNDCAAFLKGLLVFCCILYPVLQPIMVYRRAAQQLAALPKDMIIEVNGTGIHVTGDNQKSHIPWAQVRRVVKEKGITMLVIEGGRGYMLTDATLGDQKEVFLDYLESKTQNKK